MESDNQQQPFLRKNMTARVFHCVLAVFFVALMIVSIVSLGTFADKHNEIRDEIRDEVHDYNLEDLGTCILFASYESHRDDPKLHLSHGHTCGFAIWGEAIVALVATLLLGTSIAKAIAGFGV